MFEDGPSENVTLQWATYYDAADECSLSRIYGGIHPRADDIPGRLMGAEIGPDAFNKAMAVFAPAPTVTVSRGKARRRRKGKGVVTVKGTIATGVTGPEDVLDVSNGLSLMVSYGGGLSAAGELTDRDCKVKKSGKIRGRTKDRKVKCIFKPSKTVAGEYSFEVKIKVPEYGAPAEGALSLQIRDAVAVRVGSIEGCTVVSAKPRLDCGE